ncbi:hypothetical protein HDU96_006106 [Phlyctochytrium bullatum]|nr:hypothetical protein HDU96_006106 [Phlyctochytrium bullatum]
MSSDDQQQQEWLVPPGKVLTHAQIRGLLTRGGMTQLEDAVIDGRHIKVYSNAPSNMQQLMNVAQMHGDKELMVLGKERVTFNEFFDRVCKLGKALLDLGIKKGERIALLMKNCPEWIISFWATVSIGAVVVPVNGWLKPAEIDYVLRDADCAALIVDLERLKPIVPLLPALHSAGLRHVAVARCDKLDARLVKAGVRLFKDVEAMGKDADGLPDVELEPEDDATIFYTSGTTGRPKGAQGTHRQFISNLFNLAANPAIVALREGEGIPATPAPRETSIVLLAVPLFHATGCHALMSGCVLSGGKLIMMEKWDPKVALGLIEKEKITSVGGVPTMLWQILEHPDLKKYNLSSVTTIFSGGAPLAPEIMNVLKRNLPNLKVSPSNGYGLTETSALAIGNYGSDYFRKPGSVGTPALSCEVKIFKPGTEEEVPAGEIGEIAIKGPNVIRGYWRNPKATAASFLPSGYFLSGDLGYVDPEGFFYIVDRAKDMLIRGGENIYCVEVEDCLFSHPAVVDCAVVGLPHKVLGEEVAAAVTIKPDMWNKVGEGELIVWCRERLAAFKCPVFIELRKEGMPRNANGKVVKVAVRDEVRAAAKKAGRLAKL